jgi:hypothetical protein
MNQGKANVTLPEGVSLQRVAQVLLDAWEVGSHQWRDTPLALREGGETPPAPFPGDALKLFRLLHERRVPYLLVGDIGYQAIACALHSQNRPAPKSAEASYPRH